MGNDFSAGLGSDPLGGGIGDPLGGIGDSSLGDPIGGANDSSIAGGSLGGSYLA